MRDPRVPDTSPDESIADMPSSHKSRPVNPDPEGVNPQAPDSMPRGEDDAETMRKSPEFNDRPAPERPRP
jgi:hypothetical protein